MILQHGARQFDLSNSRSIAIPYSTGEQVNCYYAPPFQVTPVVMGTFIGDINQGSPVNYMNAQVNPHGNGTHTECIAHISNMPVNIQGVLKNHHFIAQIISVTPDIIENGDTVLLSKNIIPILEKDIEAVIIRTLPNESAKTTKAYSGTNPPYLEATAALSFRESGIKHILIDLPSLDREEDGGALAAHKAFWHYPEAPRLDCTITELIFVPDAIADGIYLLNLQIAPFCMDATPSNPVVYPMLK